MNTPTKEDWLALFNEEGNNPQIPQQTEFIADMTKERDLFQKDISLPTTEEKEEELKEEEEGQPKEEDLFPTEKPGRKPKYDFSDLKGYFQNKIKEGKLFPLMDETEADIALEKPEDFDLLLDNNIEFKVNEKLEAEKTKLDENWYKSKSPAWQAVAKYSEVIDNPEKLIPFIQGVKTITNFAEIDETTAEGAEKIIRYKMELSGEDSDFIDENIGALKATDKLVTTAQKLKPSVIQAEQQRLNALHQQEEKNKIAYFNRIETYKNEALKVIDAPFLNSKLSREEKADIFDMMAYPDPQLGEYKIFDAIDKLYHNKDFETLRELAYILTNKDNYRQKIKVYNNEESSKKLQAKLRTNTDIKTQTDNSQPVQQKISIIPKKPVFTV